MSPTFTDDEIGKIVETAAGEALGVVTDVDGETAYVEPEPEMTDSTRAALGWGASTDAVPIADDPVQRITDDAVRLGDEFPPESITSGGADESDGSGASERRSETDAVGATDEIAATGGNETERDGPARATETDDRDESSPDASDLDETGPGMDDHAEADEGALMDASEEIDGDAERRGSAGSDPLGESGDEADATDSGTRDDVNVDPDEVTDGDPESEIRSDEDVR